MVGADLISTQDLRIPRIWENPSSRSPRILAPVVTAVPESAAGPPQARRHRTPRGWHIVIGPTSKRRHPFNKKEKNPSPILILLQPSTTKWSGHTAPTVFLATAGLGKVGPAYSAPARDAMRLVAPGRSLPESTAPRDGCGAVLRVRRVFGIWGVRLGRLFED